MDELEDISQKYKISMPTLNKIAAKQALGISPTKELKPNKK